MDFLELAKKRCSIRKFLPNQVEREKLLKILEAGRVAPTGANAPSYKLIVVQGDEGRTTLRKAANFFAAPLAIVVCADHDKVWKRPFDGKTLTDIDASIITTHMMLEATDLGLGSVWICYFKPDVLKEVFNLPNNLEPVNILAIGYADCEPSSPTRHDKERRPLNEILFYED